MAIYLKKKAPPSYIETGENYSRYPMVINPGNPSELGYLVDEVRTIKGSLSNDGFCNEYSGHSYKRFVLIPWNPKFNHLLPKGCTPPEAPRT